MEEVMTFDRPAYSEYMEDFNYSQGFYVTPGKDGSVLLGGIRRVEDYSGERYRRAERAAEFAVAEHNSKVGEKESLKLREITNLNVEPAAGAIYYVTAAVEEASGGGDINRYQMKIWEKLNSGYKVQIFRPAPYWLKFPDMVGQNYKSSRIGITNLLPWMDENYLYYKCFFGSREVLGVKVLKRDDNRAYIWLRNCEEREKIVNKYKGRKMPQSNIFYSFEF